MKLNLGSGVQPVHGYVNVDIAQPADLIHDLRNKLPYEDNSISEILAIHVIESFYQWELPGIVKDWYRVLEDGGKLTIEFTDLKSTIDWYLSGDTVKSQRGLWGLYGNQESPIDPATLHHYVWDKDELSTMLSEDIGFKKCELTLDNIAHCEGRDWRIVCSK